MNTKTIVLVLTLSALSLLTAIALTVRTDPHRSREIQVAKAPESDPSKTAPEQKAIAAAPATRQSNPASSFTWHQVESSDYKQYIAGLRSIDCPERTIQDIILADLNKLYADREGPLKPKPKTTQAETAPSAEEMEKRNQLREIQLEKRAVIKELLGIDGPLDLLPSRVSRNYAGYEFALQSLPSAKRDTVQALQENYWQQSDGLRAKYNKQRTPEYLEEYRALSQSHRAELAKVLTPAELEDYEIHSSSSAKKMSSQLTYFQPSEDEFRQIFRATRDYEEASIQLNGQGLDKAAVESERTALQNKLNEQLKSSLGDQRLADYQRAQDSNYRSLLRIGERYGLPNETVMEAYELQKSASANSANATAQLISGDNEIIATQPAPFPREANNEIEQKLTTVLGEKAAKAFRNIRGGNVRVKNSNSNVLTP